MDNIFADEFQKVALTKNQKKIAQYCMDHQYEVCQETLNELAKNVGVTEVTILNFVRKLGYNGFSEFKNSVQNRISQQLTLQQLSLSERMKRNVNFYHESSVVENYVRMSLQNIETTLTQNKQKTYEAAAEAIMGGKRTLVCGMRSCAPDAERFARILAHVLTNTSFIPNEVSGVLQILSGIKEGDTLVLFCKKRYYKMDLSICKMTKDKGAKLVLITDSILAPMVPLADCVLLASVNSASFFDSSLGMVAIYECLTQMIALRTGEESRERWELADRYTSDFRF